MGDCFIYISDTARVDQILSYQLSCQDNNKQSRFSCYNADFPAVTANLVHQWLALGARDLMSSTGFSHKACGVLYFSEELL